MEYRAHFHEELKKLLSDVVSMGDRVIENLSRGLNSLIEGDSALASDVIKMDLTIDEMELDIEDRCVLLLARQAPVASELREIITAMKIVSELERLGDHARHLAKVTGKVRPSGLKIASPMFVDMLNLGSHMLKEALEAFIELNSTWAEEIASRDTLIDDKHSELHDKLVDLIKDKPNKAEQLVPLLLLNKHLERIGDRVTNICEFVVYTKTNRHIDLNVGRKDID